MFVTGMQINFGHNHFCSAPRVGPAKTNVTFIPREVGSLRTIIWYSETVFLAHTTHLVIHACCLFLLIRANQIKPFISGCCSRSYQFAITSCMCRMQDAVDDFPPFFQPSVMRKSQNHPPPNYQHAQQHRIIRMLLTFSLRTRKSSDVIQQLSTGQTFSISSQVRIGNFDTSFHRPASESN